MKAGEDPSSVQYDFEEYRKLVERIFRARGVLKTAWTPDGVMACFAHVEDACQSGKDVIKSLKVFNRDVKVSKADFSVRCGVNAGLVYFDDHDPARDDFRPGHRRCRPYAEARRTEYRAGGTKNHRAAAATGRVHAYPPGSSTATKPASGGDAALRVRGRDFAGATSGHKIHCVHAPVHETPSRGDAS